MTVIVLDGGKLGDEATGGRVAAPIARDVISDVVGPERRRMNRSVLGDRYRVEARIGSGGMAEVYRGIDPVLNRTVAIKVLLPQFARDAGFVARFRREAQAAARLNHPNIVGVYDTGSDGDTQFIVMEFIEGRTLARVPLEREEAHSDPGRGAGATDLRTRSAPRTRRG